MHIVNIHEAKTHLSRLLEIVERGEQVVIARAGQPVATLAAYRPPRRRIAPPGSMQGRDWQMADDFDEPIDELFSALEGDSMPASDAAALQAARAAARAEEPRARRVGEAGSAEHLDRKAGGAQR